MELGCNLEDSTMTILRAHFAILLVVSAPPDVSQEHLESALTEVAHQLDLVVAVRPLDDAPGVISAVGGYEPWTISVHGADRSGIVFGVTSALAEAGGSVVDLATHLVGEPSAPMYVMTLRVTLPAGPAAEVAAALVRRAADGLGVHCTVRPDEADVL